MLTTPAQIARLTREWSLTAGEPVRLEQVDTTLYAFGTELACLRLEHARRGGRAAYSSNLGSWFYAFGLTVEGAEEIAS